MYELQYCLSRNDANTDHDARDSKPKLIKSCTLPLDSLGSFNRVFSRIALTGIEKDRFVQRGKLPSMSVDDLRAVTRAKLVISETIGDLVAAEV